MDIDKLIAIDVHPHAEVSCRCGRDEFRKDFDEAAEKYFKFDHRPTIAETIAYYRERSIGLVMFTVDSEANIGRRRIPNEEIAEAALANSDMMIAFASIDPHKDFESAGFRPEVRPLILKENAVRMLGLESGKAVLRPAGESSRAQDPRQRG